MWWDIIVVNGLILLMFRWYTLERKETWQRSKEDCSSNATSDYKGPMNRSHWEHGQSHWRPWQNSCHRCLQLACEPRIWWNYFLENFSVGGKPWWSWNELEELSVWVVTDNGTSGGSSVYESNPVYCVLFRWDHLEYLWTILKNIYHSIVNLCTQFTFWTWIWIYH